jgi:phage terminase large subunit-like protein
MQDLSYESKLELVHLLEEKEDRDRNNKFLSLFPESGPYSRDRYPKHLEFFKAGSIHKERAFIAANRSGKTVSGAYEMSLHLTGLYPNNWEGKRFDVPIQAWAAGVTNESTRDVIQRELIGRRGDEGTGMIPKHAILRDQGSGRMRITSRPGVPDGIQDVYIKHVSGGVSELSFKSYIQGADTFQGVARHCIWLDEEPPLDVYNECLMRTAKVSGRESDKIYSGIIYMTFTPLKGLSDVVMSFLPGGKCPIDGIVPDSQMAIA